MLSTADSYNIQGNNWLLYIVVVFEPLKKQLPIPSLPFIRMYFTSYVSPGVSAVNTERKYDVLWNYFPYPSVITSL